MRDHDQVIDLAARPHRRFNPLTREWVLVSPHRNDRPWQGRVEPVAAPEQLRYDPACSLCPANRRDSGARNPDYRSTFVFDNDFPALYPDSPQACWEAGGLLLAESERGLCRVVCFSPDHSLTLSRMSQAQIRPVIDALAEQSRELLARPGIGHVQIFENRGELMGASNPHPHAQIWANQTIPNEVRKERHSLGEYRAAHGSCLLCDYLSLEEKLKERVVCAGDSFAAVVPFWAIWPFEILLLSRRHVSDLGELSPDERDDLAAMLRRIGARYDHLFGVPFPYSMGFHQGETHLHAHYFPPLLRSAAVRKFLVGYEMLAMPQRDLTAESAAERLRQSPE